MAVPAFASLHEVAIATWETAAAQTATSHHQMGAFTAMHTAAASTSVAATSHKTLPRAPIGASRAAISAHPKPLATPRK